MKSISIEFGDRNPASAFKYLTAKFLKVESWKLTPDEEWRLIEFDGPLELFETLKAPLKLLMQSDNADFGFFTHCSALIEIFEFFYKFYDFILDVRLYHQDKTGSTSEVSNAAADKVLEPIYVNTYYTRSKTLSRIYVDINSLDFCRSQFSFLERVGHCFRALHINMRNVLYIEQHDNEENRAWLNGDALAHVLNHCPNLSEISYETDTYLAVDSIRSVTPHTSIKEMTLRCETTESEVLPELQTKVPDMTDLDIETSFTRNLAYKQREITINMSQTSFDHLTIKEWRSFATSSPETPSDGLILCEIILSTQQDSRYYRLYLNYDGGLVECTMGEYQDLSNKIRSIKVTVHCRSIKNLTFHFCARSTWYSTDYTKSLM